MSDLGQIAFACYYGRQAGAALSMPDSWAMQSDASRADWDATAAAVTAHAAAAPEPAKVIIVTEVTPAGTRERRYRANSWDLTSEGDAWQLDVGDRDPGKLHRPELDGVCASYAPGAWLSVREDGADADGKTSLALAISLKALDALWTEINRPGGCNPVTLTGLAENALADLADLGYEP